MLGVPPTTAAVASSPKLLDRVRWHLCVTHYSIRTEHAYVDWIRRFILFHRKRKSPNRRRPALSGRMLESQIRKWKRH